MEIEGERVASWVVVDSEHLAQNLGECATWVTTTGSDEFFGFTELRGTSRVTGATVILVFRH